ncbi:MAG: site-2 protease family protein [Candidatus Micrarchaeia archaeon]
MAVQSLGIGKIFGIEIELHWTFLLLLLFTLLISAFVFILIVLLFVCVLIHELAHSITSLRNGIKVKKIILLPIGGASIIDDIRINPKVEFNIAIAGPIMSLFLGGIFGILVIFSPPGIITQTLQLMFEMNILLGIFNLLPAFPMDGGRVFRSYLQKKRNYFDATMLTVRVSKYLMGAIVISTFAFFAFGTSFSFAYREFMTFWDLIIVMFLWSGAQAEEQSAKIKRDTAGLHLNDAITKHFIIVDSGMRLDELYKKIVEKGEHVVITKIRDNYAYVDVYKKSRLKNAIYVRDVATVIPKLNGSMPLADALSRIESSGVSLAAVESRNKLLGIATLSSIQTIISMHLLSNQKKRASKD